MCKTDIRISVTPEQIAKWQAGALIQNVMPEVPASERELLISGTCDDCFHQLFRDED